ncbi:acetate/propionate family kinase [Paramagnetospirillum magneticum]|uniref:Acetate kinase n=1 Tax=Paramagnetospirillum magneticum (strain ATCC 700264 / AMB-1) TaxID=342108 RepID=Q2W467_PARM1|nr:acetate/propionate family kinase [Paramagnetospirillum magneticum]BAE51358.1 Acetate kinase [Paramagnetospirillum magneticum AMB-1]
MREGILVINAGSSSIKFSLYISNGDEKPLLSCKGQVEGINVAPHFIAKSPHGGVLNEQRWPDQPNMSHEALFKYMIEWIEAQLGDAELKAAGHRVVHGGSQYSQPLLVNDELMEELEKLIPLAPLHQPHNLAPIRALTKVHPGLTQVACFDTAFHRSNPWTAQSFALPRKITGEGVKRYGFHGLSYEFIARQMRQLSPAAARGKVVVCHLGSGASMCAIDGGKSVASTMGFTAVDGLPMGTRTGTMDAGVILYLLQQKGMTPKEIEDLLYKQSGLLGVSGVSNDMRILLESSEPHAAEAVELFVYRISRELGSLAAAMGGLDALVFTAGIGERSPQIRERVCAHAEWLGVEMDQEANQRDSLLISAADSPVSVWVIPTDEEMMIAKHTRELLRSLRD